MPWKHWALRVNKWKWIFIASVLMGIFLWLQEVFQHILNGQQPHFPCWMIRRQTHNCTLRHIVFTQPHLLAFVVHEDIFFSFPPATVLQCLSGVTCLKTVGEIPTVQVKWQGFLCFHICITSRVIWSLFISLNPVLQSLCFWSAPAWHPGGLSHPFRFRNSYNLPTWGLIHLHTVFISVWCMAGFWIPVCSLCERL